MSTTKIPLVLKPVPQFVTIDPGLNASGYAVWDRGVLREVGLLRVPSKARGLTNRVRAQMNVYLERSGVGDFEGWPVVAECMRHRPMPRFRGAKRRFIDPQDLIHLNLLSGALGDLWVEPAAWKGNVSQEDEQTVTKRVLQAAELYLMEAVLPASLRKECWSAVGLGLSVLGRAHLKCGWTFA